MKKIEKFVVIKNEWDKIKNINKINQEFKIILHLEHG